MKIRKEINKELFLEGRGLGGENCPIWLKTAFYQGGAFNHLFNDTTSKTPKFAKYNPDEVSKFIQGEYTQGYRDYSKGLVNQLNRYTKNNLGKTLDYSNLKIYAGKKFPDSWDDKLFNYPYVMFLYFDYINEDGTRKSQVWAPGINNDEKFTPKDPIWAEKPNIIKTPTFKNTFLPFHGTLVGVVPNSGYNAGIYKRDSDGKVLLDSDGNKIKIPAIDILKMYVRDWCYINLEDPQNFKLADDTLSRDARQNLNKQNLTINDQGEVVNKDTNKPATNSKGVPIKLKSRNMTKDELKSLDNYFRKGHDIYKNNSIVVSDLFQKVLSEHPELKDDMFDKSGYIVDPSWYMNKAKYQELKGSNVGRHLSKCYEKLTQVANNLDKEFEKIQLNNYNKRYELLQMENELNLLCAYWDKLNELIEEASSYKDEEEKKSVLKSLIAESHYNFFELNNLIDQLAEKVNGIKHSKFDINKVRKLTKSDLEDNQED